jgi:hypothetical protein
MDTNAVQIGEGDPTRVFADFAESGEINTADARRNLSDRAEKFLNDANRNTNLVTQMEDAAKSNLLPDIVLQTQEARELDQVMRLLLWKRASRYRQVHRGT